MPGCTCSPERACTPSYSHGRGGRISRSGGGSRTSAHYSNGVSSAGSPGSAACPTRSRATSRRPPRSPWTGRLRAARRCTSPGTQRGRGHQRRPRVRRRLPAHQDAHAPEALAKLKKLPWVGDEKTFKRLLDFEPASDAERLQPVPDALLLREDLQPNGGEAKGARRSREGSHPHGEGRIVICSRVGNFGASSQQRA